MSVACFVGILLELRNHTLLSEPFDEFEMTNNPTGNEEISWRWISFACVCRWNSSLSLILIFIQSKKKFFCFYSDIQVSEDDDDDDTPESRKNQDTLYDEAQGDQIDISDVDTSTDIFGK